MSEITEIITEIVCNHAIFVLNIIGVQLYLMKFEQVGHLLRFSAGIMDISQKMDPTIISGIKHYNLTASVKRLLLTSNDLTWPDAQFFVEGYNKSLQLDVSRKSEGLVVFNKSHLPTRQLTKIKIPMDIKIIIFELT